jgi:hypothetical protein
MPITPEEFIDAFIESPSGNTCIKVCAIDDVQNRVNVDDDWLGGVKPFCNKNDETCEYCQ